VIILSQVPLELVVSIGTGCFSEIKVPPRVGWDGVVAQILDSATDGEMQRFFRINVSVLLTSHSSWLARQRLS